MRKILCFALAALMLITLLSCAQPQEEVFDVDFRTGSDKSFDFDGADVVFWASLFDGAGIADNVFGYDYDTELADLARARIAEVSDSYNCNVTYEYKAESHTVFANCIAGGSSPCEMLLTSSENISSWGKAGLLASVNGDLNEYIDYTDSHKWGNSNLLECCFYKGNIYGVYPASWPDLIYASGGYPLAANMDIINSIGGDDPRELYEQGVWTWDTFNEQLEKCTVIEGSETKIYGLVSHLPYLAEMFYASNGVAFARIDGKVSFECGFYSDAAYAAAEEINHIIYGPLAYTYTEAPEYFEEERASYGFIPNGSLFSVTSSISKTLDNYAILRTPIGPDVPYGHAGGIFENPKYIITFPTPVVSPTVEMAAIVADALFEPLPGFETFEDVKAYMAHNNFFDERDADAFFDVFYGSYLNYFYQTRAVSRSIPAETARTNVTLTELIEKYEDSMTELFNDFVGEMLETYTVLYPEEVK